MFAKLPLQGIPGLIHIGEATGSATTGAWRGGGGAGIGPTVMSLPTQAVKNTSETSDITLIIRFTIKNQSSRH